MAHDVGMPRADPLFKLRLPDYLREKLEKAATDRRQSLTAEILARLEESFSDLSERLRVVEDEVFHRERGNEALHSRVDMMKLGSVFPRDR
jgi:hypothetical protein